MFATSLNLRRLPLTVLQRTCGVAGFRSLLSSETILNTPETGKSFSIFTYFLHTIIFSWELKGKDQIFEKDCAMFRLNNFPDINDVKVFRLAAKFPPASTDPAFGKKLVNNFIIGYCEMAQSPRSWCLTITRNLLWPKETEVRKKKSGSRKRTSRRPRLRLPASVRDGSPHNKKSRITSPAFYTRH